MKSISATKGKGWRKDYPDYRDNTPNTDTLTVKQVERGVKIPVQAILEKANNAPPQKSKKAKADAPITSIDLTRWCSPIEDQGRIGSCTAHAGVGLYEYYERRAFGKHIDGSRLFLYKATRNLLEWNGDDGAYLRTTMAALALFGVVPERYWPYNEMKYNDEPSAFLYSYAQSFQALLYYRLDSQGITRPDLLDRVKDSLLKGFPLIFGFSCYTSLEAADNGKIPFPSKNEDVEGGHAVMAVGFDDSVVITNPFDKNIVTRGAFLIRNSWGIEWGENGYGWLPYEYLLRGIAEDWWSMTKAEWIDTGMFGNEIA